MTTGNHAHSGAGREALPGSAHEPGTAPGAGAAPQGAVPPPRRGPAAAEPGPASGPLSGPGADAGPAGAPGAEEWRGVGGGLLRMRRLMLLCVTLPVAVAAALVPGLLAGPAWAAFALIPLAVAAWGRGALARNWRSWRYAERADDLLISRGVLWRELTVVPYGRMQLVEVTSGPLERRYGLSRLQLHTAAATTDAAIPGLAPDEAERLRDRLTELGNARSAGL